MARPTTSSFGKGFFYLGDGEVSEVFTKICGLTNIKIDFDKATNDVTVPDCDDPDAPAWLERDVVSQSASFSASGVLAKESLPFVDDAFRSSTSRTGRLDIVGFGSGGATPNLRFSGKFHLKYSIKGERGSKYEIDISAESDGEITRTSVA